MEAEVEDNKGEVLALAFSPDGGLLAAGDVSLLDCQEERSDGRQATGRIILVDVKEKKTLVSSKWTFHTGRITALAFSSSGKRIASAGMDESIYVWEVEKTLKNTPIKVSGPRSVSH